MEKLGYSGKEWIRRIEEEYEETEVRKKVEDLNIQYWKASLEK